MLRFFGRRVLLLAFTLAVASVLIFAITNVLPGDVARIILGPFAPQDAVTRLNAELGADRPVVIRYVEWLAGAQGDWGRSYAFNTAVFPLCWSAWAAPSSLAASGLAVLVPLAIASGVAAAKARRRASSTASSPPSASPSAPCGIRHRRLPDPRLRHLARRPADPGALPRSAGPLTVAAHLVLPIGCLVLLLFAYLFRMTRASMIEALAADYTRTATLKGLPPRTVIWRHVLRNALLPTVTVIGAQIGWLVGGLVVVETLFKYPGIGGLIHFAATNKDIPLLVGCSLAITFVFALGNLAADLLYAVLNPRVRHGRNAH